MENGLELAVLSISPRLHLGARILPISQPGLPRDFEKILHGKEQLLLFTLAGRSRPHRAGVGRPSNVARHVLAAHGGTGQRTTSAHLLNFDFAAELARHRPSDATFQQAADHDVLMTMYTSGTTKLSQRHRYWLGRVDLRRPGVRRHRRVGLGSENRFFNVLPMTYLGGSYNLMFIPILAEGSFVLDAAFGPTSVYAFWERVEEQRINTLWFTATMLSMLMSLEDDVDLSFLKQQMRIGLCGMAPLAVDLKRRFEQRFGFTLYENYGIRKRRSLRPTILACGYKDDSTGTILPGVQLQIVDQQLLPLPTGKEGQILVKTPYFMQGYRECAQTDQATILPSGAFLTGDIGRVDQDGELFVTGRLKDLIIRGGVNITPKAVEDTIYRLDDVEEVAVVGIPHPVYGEEVAAVVKVRDTRQERREHGGRQEILRREHRQLPAAKVHLFYR